MPIKILIISLFFLTNSLNAQADSAAIGQQAKSVIASIDRYIKLKKDFPKRDSSQTLRKTQRDVLIFNNSLVAKTTEAFDRLKLEASIDYYQDECERSNRIPTLCKAAETQIAKYKKDYNTDYKPKKPTYPEIDLTKHTYSLAGKTYDLKNLKYITPTSAPAVITEPKPAVSSPQRTAATETATVSATAKAQTSVDEEYSCEWDKSLPPRKLLYAPGCNGKEKLCTGYVKCNKNGWKINRLATCGDEFCTDSTATECAKQKNYGSKTSRAEAPEPAQANIDPKDVGVSNGN